MTEKTEALRLAEVSPYLEGGERGRWIIDASAELRRLHASCEDYAQHKQRQDQRILALCAQRDALLETLRHAAAIAHSGGLQGMTEWQSLVAVRRLTQPYFERSGSITETHDRLRAAIKAVEEQK